MSAKSRRILAKLRDRDTRKRLLEALNASTAPEGAPVSGGSGEMKVLQEMNELQEFENDNENTSYASGLAGGVYRSRIQADPSVSADLA